MKSYLDDYLSKLFRQSVLRNLGVNIPKDRRVNCSTKEVTMDKSGNNYLVYFAMPFDNELLADLGLNSRAVPYDGVYIVPHKDAKCRDIIEVTYNDISEILKGCPLDEQTKMSRWLSEEAREEYKLKIKEIKDKALDKIKELPLYKLTREETKANFLHLLYCLKYAPMDNKKCWDAYNKNWTDFPGQPDAISENRAFYVMSDGKYFVVSKNLYDVFFASQGNGFESCFSLTSCHKYIRGVPYWMSHNGYYMCYITDGDTTKWSAIPGHKLKLPKMECRAWGYKLKNGGFGIGKTYDKTQNRSLMYDNPCVTELFPGRKNYGEVDGEHFNVGKYSVYYDNLSDDFRFNSEGMRGRGDTGNIRTVSDTLKKVTKFNDQIEYMDSVMLSSGAFVAKVLLPKSGLIVSKLNKVIENMLDEQSDVSVHCLYEFIDGRISELEVIRGGLSGSEVDFEVFFSHEGTIKIKKDGGDETVIASV